jgi:hypothetical protein
MLCGQVWRWPLWVGLSGLMSLCVCSDLWRCVCESALFSVLRSSTLVLCRSYCLV